MIGKTISHYKITEKLGEGGMGDIYKAEDLILKRNVALKFLAPELTRHADVKARFVREAETASALDHQNICTIHEIGETENGHLFIAMACYEGETLKEKLARGLLSLNETIDIAQQVAKGLAKAHDLGIVHRDIKPSNVFLTTDGLVKVLDFGIAKFTGQAHVTKTGTMIGTISYMSPEQIQAADVDQRTDLWSFGVLLYEMVTRQRPFKGDIEAAIIYEVLNKEPEALLTFKPDIPIHLVSLVSKLLQKDPSKRISSANEVIDRLQDLPVEVSTEAKKKSVAVLYFENMSSEKENEYFCAGMTDDLIVDFSKIHGLRVIPRSDVLPFRNKEVNSRQVGETLGVDYVFEGSVRKAASKVRITAQMIDVISGFQIWAERYDRLIEDIFDVQIEVSEKIAEALKISITETEKQSLAKKPTDDVRAYDFYLRGSELLLLRWKEERHTAVQMFEHALSIDPHFSLAYVALAEAYSYNYLFFGGGRKWLEKMMEMNEKALSLDPDLIEAKFGIGMAYFLQKRYQKSAQEFQKVIVLKSDFYPAHWWLIWTLIVLSEFDSAIWYAKLASEIKPYSEEPWHLIELSLRKKGENKSADEAGAKVIELAKRKLEVNPKDVMALSRMAIADANLGNIDTANRVIDRIIEIDPDDGLALYNCACVFSILGKKEKSLEFLTSSLKKGTANLIAWIIGDPYLDLIRDLPEFRNLMVKYRDWETD